MKLLLIFFCLLVSLPGLGQDEDEGIDVTTADEQSLQELEAKKKAQAEGFQKINEGAEAIKNTPSGILEELKKTGGKLDPNALFNPKIVEMLKENIKNSRIQELPPGEIRALILAKVKGRPMERVFEQFPKILDIAVDIIRDPRAFNGLMDILPRFEDLKFFGYCALGLMVFGFLLKRFIVKKDASFSKRLLLGMTIHVLVMLSSFGIFYSMFEKEITPTLNVISKHF